MDSWLYLNVSRSMWIAELITLRSNCAKVQKNVQEQYPFLFQINIYSRYGKKMEVLTFHHAFISWGTIKRQSWTLLIRASKRVCNFPYFSFKFYVTDLNSRFLRNWSVPSGWGTNTALFSIHWRDMYCCDVTAEHTLTINHGDSADKTLPHRQAYFIVLRKRHAPDAWTCRPSHHHYHDRKYNNNNVTYIQTSMFLL
jgi:hypothetical protein